MGTLDPAAGDREITLADGRTLAFRDFGAPDGRPLIALHGTPGSRLKFSVAHEAAVVLGLRMIAPDRWGYGASSLHARPSLAGYAADVASLADHLCLRSFGLLGVSGGGPYACAVAATLPHRVDALALVAPVGPISGDATLELSSFHRFCFTQLPRAPRTVGLIFQALRGGLRIAPDLAMRVAMIRNGKADQVTLRVAGVRARLARTFSVGLESGVIGPVIDMQLFGAPWEIPFAAIAAPARLWIGTADRNVPAAAATALARRIPGCTVVELAGEGHLWIATRYSEVLSWLADTTTGAP